MKFSIDYLLNIVYYLLFGLFLVIFHPLQLLAFWLFGVRAQQKVVHVLNGFLLSCLYVLGTQLKYENKSDYDLTKPIIVVANHQSMFDIILIIWYLRGLFPIFVSKKELGAGIPSISLNLRLSGAALIDRKDSRQAIPEITRMAKWAKAKSLSPVIFPEGTRSKTQELKPFAVGGLAVLLKQLPNAQLLPVAIKGNNLLNPKGFFPLSSFKKVKMTILPVIASENKKAEELTALVELAIKTELGF